MNQEQEISKDTDMESMDDVKNLYANETRQNLNKISNMLELLSDDQVLLSESLVEINRISHSIRGDSNALGFSKIGDEAHKFEAYVLNFQKHPDLFKEESIQVMNSYVNDILRRLQEEITLPESEENYSNTNVMFKATGNLLNSRSDKIEFHDGFASTQDDNTDEIKKIYSVEASEHIENIIRRLIELESERIPLQNALADIYREVHSVKGDSNALGFIDIGEIAHDFESLISLIQKDNSNYDSQALEKMFDYSENIKTRLSSIFSGQDKVSEKISFKEETFELNEINSLYLTEVREHIENIYNKLAEIKSGSGNLGEILKEIYREVHSVKGDSNALGFADIGEEAHKFETYAVSAQKNVAAFEPEMIDEMLVFNQNLNDVLNSMFGSADDQSAVSLEEQISQGFKAELEDIKTFYFSEASDHIENIHKMLLKAESGQSNINNIIPEIFRRIHSLKGDSYALGFSVVGDKAHELENLINIFQETPEADISTMIEDIFKALNQIKILVDNPDKINSNEPIDTSKIKMDEIKTITLPKFDQSETINNKFSTEKDVVLKTLDIEMQKNKELSLSQKADEETIRVSLQKIDKIVNLSGELLISKISHDQAFVDIKKFEESMQSYISLIRRQISSTINPLETKIHKEHLEKLAIFDESIGYIIRTFKRENARFSFLVDELQYDSRNTRMLPASVLTDPLRIIARNTSKKLNKKVNFTVIGENIEIDRFLIEKLKDPLSHIIRNAIDHGVESPLERRSKNKPDQANVIINISLFGNNVNFDITDDGHGIDYLQIKNKAIKSGLISTEQADLISDEEVKQLIFYPGFSTAEKITDISGRGVGLDVVKSSIEGLSGKIFVASELGRGTIFKLSLPITLTTFEGFLIKSSSQIFAVPKSFVIKIVGIKTKDIVKTNSDLSILVDEKPVKVIYLSDVLKLPRKPLNECMALILEAGSYTMALLVDEILEAKKMFMKNLGSQLKRVKNFSGTTLLGTGEPVLIINVSDITGSVFSSGSYPKLGANVS